jgi:hypothetical protein
MSIWSVTAWWRYRRVTLRWAAPSTYTNGVSIGSPVTYQVWSKEGYAPIAVNLTATSYSFRVLDDEARHCFYVRAVVGGHVSAGSNIACVNV